MIKVPAFLAEQAPPVTSADPPPVCAEFARLLGEWYTVPDILADGALQNLRQHSAHCLRCLKRHNWYAEQARSAAHPDLSVEEIDNA